MKLGGKVACDADRLARFEREAQLLATALAWFVLTSSVATADPLVLACERALGPDPGAGKLFSLALATHSPDLARVAFRVERMRMAPLNAVGVYTQNNLRNQLIIDGVASEEFDFAESPVFSPDGAHVAYVAGMGAAKFIPLPATTAVLQARTDVTWLVRDGVKSPDYFDVDSFVFSPDSRHVAYVSAEVPGQYHLYIDAERIVSTVPSVEPRFNEMGEMLAVVASEPEGQSVLVLRNEDGRFGPLRQSPKHEAVRGIDFVAPDGGLVYRASDNGRERLIDGDVSGPPYRAIAEPQFAADRDHVVYLGQLDNGQVAVVLDHRELAVADRIEGLTLSEDGRHVAYYAVRDEQRVAERDGVALHEAVSTSWGSYLLVREFARLLDIRQIALSANGERVAFIQPVARNREAVSIDGKLSQPWRRVTSSLRFSDDGAHVAYWAWGKQDVLMRDDMELDSYRRGRQFFVEFIPASGDVLAPHWSAETKTWSLALNGEPGPVAFDSVGPIRVEPPTTIHVVGTREGEYYLAILSLDGRGPLPGCESWQ